MRIALPIALAVLAGCFAPGDDGHGGAPTAMATVAMDFGGFRAEDPQNLSEEVTFAPDAPPTKDMYETPRPDGYTAHDLVAQWAQNSGTPVTVHEHAAFGYVLQEVDGVVAHSSQGGSWLWALSVDGKPTTDGMSTVVVDEGSTYRWTFQYQPR